VTQWFVAQTARKTNGDATAATIGAAPIVMT
jgi:hypothetical protein